MSSNFDPPSDDVTRREFLASPLFIATVLSLGFMTITAIYVWFSTRAAVAVSSTVEDVGKLEMAKGYGYAFVVGALLFLLAFGMSRRIASQRATILAQQISLFRAEDRAHSALFASSLVHDMNHALGLAQAHLSELELECKGLPRTQAPLQGLFDVVNGLTSLSMRLTRLSHQRGESKVHTVDIAPLVRRLISLTQSHPAIKYCRISFWTEGSPLYVRCEEGLINRMLFNLILNAAEATGGSGVIEINLRSDNEYATMEVHDDGQGIPEKEREAIFEPFYTSKATGTGLGLVSVKLTAAEHHGWVEVGESKLGGACFRVILPISGSASAESLRAFRIEDANIDPESLTEFPPATSDDRTESHEVDLPDGGEPNPFPHQPHPTQHPHQPDPSVKPGPLE